MQYGRKKPRIETSDNSDMIMKDLMLWTILLNIISTDESVYNEASEITLPERFNSKEGCNGQGLHLAAS